MWDNYYKDVMTNYLDVAELYARLRTKENPKFLASQDLHNRNLQWLNDIAEEARALFKKDSKKGDHTTRLEESNTTKKIQETAELDDSGCSTIILLPKTPRVRILRSEKEIGSLLAWGPSYLHHNKTRLIHVIFIDKIYFILGKESSR